MKWMQDQGRWMRRLAGAGVLAAAGVAPAGTLGTGVTVSVRFVPSSGVCEVAPAELGVEVACNPPGGPLLPAPGDVAYRRVGTIPAGPVVPEPLPVYSDGTKITSWRVVTLDNSRYVELTIAW